VPTFGRPWQLIAPAPKSAYSWSNSARAGGDLRCIAWPNPVILLELFWDCDFSEADDGGA
jgi:hypothetical protein